MVVERHILILEEDSLQLLENCGKEIELEPRGTVVEVGRFEGEGSEVLFLFLAELLR